MNYLLMSLDTPILFICCERNAFEKAELQEIAWLSSQTLVGYVDLETFLSHRKALKQCKHMGALFDHYHCNDTEGFLSAEYAVFKVLGVE